jgi:hypothetical protein
MKTSVITTRDINNLLPGFEAAVYDPLIEQMFGEIDEGPEMEQLRTHVARLPFCEETTEVGRAFFIPRLGYAALRQEIHAVDGEKHRFLTSMKHTERITEEDIIVDPTYLQYSTIEDLDTLHRSYPRVFVGARMVLMNLMLGDNFKGQRAARLYAPETLQSIA